MSRIRTAATNCGPGRRGRQILLARGEQDVTDLAGCMKSRPLAICGVVMD